jgi:hypothetical protein
MELLSPFITYLLQIPAEYGEFEQPACLAYFVSSGARFSELKSSPWPPL